MKKALIIFLFIGAFIPLAYSDDPPAVDIPQASPSAEATAMNQPAIIPPPVAHIFEGDVNGVKYHDEASFHAAADAAWEARKQVEIDKAVKGGYIVGLNGTEYGSPEAFARRDYENSMTYIGENGIPTTYGDGSGSGRLLKREEYLEMNRENFAKMKAQNEAHMKEMRAMGIDSSDPAYQNVLEGNRMFDARFKEIADGLGTMKPLVSSGSNPREAILTPSVVGGANANKPQITILNNMGIRNNLSSSSGTSTISSPVTSLGQHGIGLSPRDRGSEANEPQRKPAIAVAVQKPKVLVSG